MGDSGAHEHAERGGADALRRRKGGDRRQVSEEECDFLVEQRLAQQVEPDYLEDPRFRVVMSIPFLDLNRTQFPWRSFYLPIAAFERHWRYNPYYLARRAGAGKQGEEEEICLEEDRCVLESSDEYLEEAETSGEGGESEESEL